MKNFNSEYFNSAHVFDWEIFLLIRKELFYSRVSCFILYFLDFNSILLYDEPSYVIEEISLRFK